MSRALCFGHLCLPFGKRRTQVRDIRGLCGGVRGSRPMGGRECQHGGRRRGHERNEDHHERDATAVGARPWRNWLRMVHVGSRVTKDQPILTDCRHQWMPSQAM